MKIEKNNGFTLIELMVVVAIIGVLLAAAIPQYQRYQARSAVSTALDTTRPIKLAYQEYLSLNGVAPDNTQLDITGDGTADTLATANTCSTFVDNITIGAAGQLVLAFWAASGNVNTACPQNARSATPAVLHGTQITLVPLASGVGTTWAIDLTTANATTVPSHLLPKSVPTS